MITEALGRASVNKGYRCSILWAYPLITEISLERDAEGHIGWPVSRGCTTVTRMVNENQ